MRKKLRSLVEENPQSEKAHAFDRMMKLVEKEFSGCNQTQIAKGLGFTEGNYRNILKKRRVNLKTISALAERGFDVAYVLTGKTQDGRKELRVSDPLEEIINPPHDCPNRGLCVRLAKLVRLVQGLTTPEVLSRADPDLVEIAGRAVLDHRVTLTKQEATETCSPSKDDRIARENAIKPPLAQ